VSAEPRLEGPCPPWWRPGAQVAWRLARERRIAWYGGFDEGRSATLGALWDLLESKGFVK
jgi:hypothetical protein